MGRARWVTSFPPDCIRKSVLQFHGRSSLAHVVELGATNALALDHLEVADKWTIERNGSLHSNTQYEAPHYERRPKLYTPQDCLVQGSTGEKTVLGTR